MIEQLVEPAGMFTVVVPVVAFAATFTVPEYVAVGVEHDTVNGNAIALVTAGPPVMFFVTVSTPGLGVFVIVQLNTSPAVGENSVHCCCVARAVPLPLGSTVGEPLVELVQDSTVL